MAERILDHVGIAVHALDDAIPTWTSIIGSPAVGRETVSGQAVEVVFVGAGPGRVELLAPTRPDSPVARFLERRGPGLHHLCYAVPDIALALRKHRDEGFTLIDTEPRRGAHDRLVAFLHPGTSDGVLVELVQDVGA